MRHVCVAVNREPVGSHRYQRLQRAPKAAGCLPRESVDQVDVHGAEAAPATGGYGGESLIDTLNAIDRTLYIGGEVLDTETRPVESELRQVLDVAGLHNPRIE